MLSGLFKAVRNEKLALFCARDFDREDNRTAALKNGCEAHEDCCRSLEP